MEKYGIYWQQVYRVSREDRATLGLYTRRKNNIKKQNVVIQFSFVFKIGIASEQNCFRHF